MCSPCPKAILLPLSPVPSISTAPDRAFQRLYSAYGIAKNRLAISVTARQTPT